MLVHPRYDAHTSLTVDTSDMAVGGVIEQKINNKWQPLAFFSKQLCKPEQRYSAFDRELLELSLAIRHFRFLLEAHTFMAFTDHKPLTFAMSKRSEPWSARQQRHLLHFELHHRHSTHCRQGQCGSRYTVTSFIICNT